MTVYPSESAERLDGIDGIVRRVVLADRLHDARDFELKRSRHDDLLAHQADLEAACIDRIADLDCQILKACFRQVRSNCERVALVAAFGRMRGRKKHNAVTAGITRSERAIVHVGRHDFLRDTERTGQCLGAGSAALQVQVVVHFSRVTIKPIA